MFASEHYAAYLYKAREIRRWAAAAAASYSILFWKCSSYFSVAERTEQTNEWM